MADAAEKEVNGIVGQKSHSWSHEQDLKLLEKVEKHLDGATETKNIFIKDIVWNKVKFDGFDEHEVQKRWNTLTSRIRKMRTAKEVLEDAKRKVADQKDSRKRKRDETDPTLPKMPLTAYLIFCEERRPRMAEKYSTLGSKQLMAKLAKKWRKLSEEKKEKYKEMYREKRQKYEHDLTQYFVEHNPDETAPKTAFDLWAETKATEMKKSRPDISEKKLKKKLNKYWERLEDKEQWEKKAKKEVDKFIKRMKKKV